MNDHQEPLEQWLAYRREQTANLDIRQAVQRELKGSTFSPSPLVEDSQTFRFPLIRISMSSLLRLGITIGWFLTSANASTLNPNYEHHSHQKT